MLFNKVQFLSVARQSSLNSTPISGHSLLYKVCRLHTFAQKNYLTVLSVYSGTDTGGQGLQLHLRDV